MACGVGWEVMQLNALQRYIWEVACNIIHQQQNLSVLSLFDVSIKVM